MNLPDRLKKVRSDLGKSQKDIAGSLGIAVRTWQVYEEGGSVPGGNVLEGLARLGININWLLTGEGPMKRNEAPDLGNGRIQVGVDIDLDRLTLAIETIDEALQAMGRTMRANKKSEIVAAVYDFYGDEDQEKAKTKVIRLLKTAI